MHFLSFIAGSALLAGTTVLAAPGEIVSPANAPECLQLAAKEVRRYIYLRTGKILPITAQAKDSSHAVTFRIDTDLQEQTYRLKSDRQSLVITGGSEIAVLYGAYAFAEKLGIRFYLHGDVVPDGRIPFSIPQFDETHKPLFDTRGIQPFHDFPEGPDWWSTDDYRAYLTQLPKLRMNFIGFHNYPGEFLLWHGVAEDVNPDGTVKSTYPSKWFSNALSGWGYAALKTSEFTAGAAELFSEDHVSSEVVGNDDRHFDRVGRLLGTIVKDAHARGIKVAVGTETPLRIPGPVQARLRALGKSNDAEEIYKGTFTWLLKNAPVDYYWAWTPESWIWSGNSAVAYQAVASDLKAARAATDALSRPFPVGTCGWVLGPQQNRAAWDELLPKDAPIANINPLAGHGPVDPSFSTIKDRPTWAIPWFENDPDMVGYQPWVKRTRYDAVDALRRGCSGLIGIHWRTKILAPNISALAQAGWDQSWARPDQLLKGVQRNPGTAATFTTPVADTPQDPVYQTLRYGLEGYPVEVPNGTYTVILKFSEPHHAKPGKRVFGVNVQGRNVAEHLDIFARVGRNHAFDLSVPDVRVEDGVVDIRFVPEVEFPFVAGIEIIGTTVAVNQIPSHAYARRINVGGPAWDAFEADVAKVDASEGGLDRAMPADDFYRDFARANFGEDVAEDAADVLTESDGFAVAFNPKYPGFSATSEWKNGPGALRTLREPWDTYRTRHYAFVGKFAALRPQVKGAGNLERFDYWCNTLRATELMAQLACQRGVLDIAIEKMQAELNVPAKQRLAQSALDLRRHLVRDWEKLIRLQIALVSTPGELGTLANLEQHSRVNNQWLTVHDKALAAAMGAPLPVDCAPSRTYVGPARLIVPTVRSSVAKGEELKLKIIALDHYPVKSVTVKLRPLGSRDWQEILANHIARAVWNVILPAATEDFEYFITAEFDHSEDSSRISSSKTHQSWPATAPLINQTIVVESDCSDSIKKQRDW